MADTDQQSVQFYARFAGFMYLFVAAAYIAGLLITSSIAGTGGFAIAAPNIAASAQIYRVGLAIAVIGVTSTLPLAGAFYGLLKPVSPNLALFAFFFRSVEAVFFSVVMLLYYITLNIATGALGGIDVAGQQAAWNLASRAQLAAANIASIYFSFGAMLFSKLLLKARFIPRLLAFSLLLSGLVSLITALAAMIAPLPVARLQLQLYGGIFLLASELLAGLWLLIFGANLKYWNDRATMIAA